MLKSQENHKMEDKVVQLKQIIEESDNIVFFGGAGVSTESGIPDFIKIVCYMKVRSLMSHIRLLLN